MIVILSTVIMITTYFRNPYLTFSFPFDLQIFFGKIEVSFHHGLTLVRELLRIQRYWTFFVLVLDSIEGCIQNISFLCDDCGQFDLLTWNPPNSVSQYNKLDDKMISVTTAMTFDATVFSYFSVLNRYETEFQATYLVDWVSIKNKKSNPIEKD